MAKNNTRLELTWIGKENRPKLEPRILIEEPEKSYHAAHRVNENDIFDNRLIFGDNLLALKALEQEFTGKIKCIYIDPPYNTGSAFTYYNDGVEHSLWLSLMRDRLELLRRLLSDDGSIWISIDDNECHYLKVMMDEVFGREQYITCVIWQKMFSPKSTARHLSESHDYILLFAKDKNKWERNLLPRTEVHDRNYKNPDNDPRGPWTSGDLSARNYYSAGTYEIVTPKGRKIEGPPKGMYWRVSKDKFFELDRDNRIWWGKKGDNQPRLKRFLSDVMEGIVPQTIWFHGEVGNTQEAKKEIIEVVPGVQEVFQTTKPERMLKRIIEIATNPGDWVLDSFAGSGTTGAVAHKTGRRWIMVELGEHCHSLVLPRMKRVVDGGDEGGISKVVRWRGGGGFRYYRLGPTLITEDEWGNPVINPEFNAGMLTEAMCKLEGFTFDPNPEVYWQQGRSSETDFIYVTTQFMSKDMLAKISDEAGPNRSLLICCSAFRCDTSQFENLTVKKIPKAVLKKCEWGHDDYSMEVNNLPELPPETTDREADDQAAKKPVRKFGKGKNAGATLFDMSAVTVEGGE